MALMQSARRAAARRLLSLMCLLLLTAGVVFWMSRMHSYSQAESVARVGEPMPAADFDSVLGGAGGFDSLKGTSVLAHFFSVDCGYCRDSLTMLGTLHSETQGRGDLAIVGIVSGAELLSASMSWPQTIGYHLWLDRSGQLKRKLGALRVPATFLVDQAGVVRYRHIGALSLVQMRNIVSQVEYQQ
jgi:cytochrome c biogenesis protein CcmG, thiol:disulfide interchange protein DsbE